MVKSNLRMPHALELIHPRSLKHFSNQLQGLVKGKLWAKVLLGMVLGIAFGLSIGPEVGFIEPELAFLIGEWVALPGIIFLRVIQMIVIPLIFASIIRGIAASENAELLKKLGVRIAGYFVFTTTVAIIIGIGMATLINPGQYVSPELLQATTGLGEPSEQTAVETPGLVDLPSAIGSVLPNNIFISLFNGELLQIVLFAVIFGIALVNMPVEQSKPLLVLMGSLQEVSMKIVKWAMLLAPFAVFGLLARITSQLGIEALLGVGVYVITVILGLIVLMVFYLVLIWVVGRKSPIFFLRNAKDVQLLAFSTSSSAAVMPLSIKTAEEKLGVRPSISQFVIPIGASINMDGTALYQAIATLFLAQVFGIDLGLTALLLLIVTIVGASIGAPGTPGVGIAILSVVLTSAGIPLAGIALIIGVDRILDMCRTVLNVTGDLTACLVMDRWVGGIQTTEQQLKEAAELKGEDIAIRKVAPV